MSGINRVCDFLVIGAGLAGLAFALKVSKFGSVIVLSKARSSDTNSDRAQGGICAVAAEDDSFENHIRDTLTAGAGLCHLEAVRNVVETAPERIQDLTDWGVKFDMGSEGKVDLTREGGHSHRRIWHVKDHTGHDIHKHLLRRVQENPNIEILENHHAIDLILNSDLNLFNTESSRCLGAHVLDSELGKTSGFLARVTYLATGGAGRAYLYTSNWRGATGDGVAMAYRAGARVGNLEFMQFHPTSLHHPMAANFLLTEALRGEGAILLNSKGEAFAQKYHALGNLAPRDIVTRMIDSEMKKHGSDCVYLDITHKPADFVKSHFPSIHRRCMEFGLDLTKQPIPTVPSAHYLCGGVVSDLKGRTDIPGLLVGGETGFTGLHGANRLASNSLLECLVFAENAFQYVKNNFGQFPASNAYPENPFSVVALSEDKKFMITQTLDEVRRLMWNNVGIVRSDLRLAYAQKRIREIMDEVNFTHAEDLVQSELLELRNITQIADLTVKCAIHRRESRGIHFNLDVPNQLEMAHDSILDSRSRLARSKRFGVAG